MHLVAEEGDRRAIGAPSARAFTLGMSGRPLRGGLIVGQFRPVVPPVGTQLAPTYSGDLLDCERLVCRRLTAETPVVDGLLCLPDSRGERRQAADRFDRALHGCGGIHTQSIRIVSQSCQRSVFKALATEIR